MKHYALGILLFIIPLAAQALKQPSEITKKSMTIKFLESQQTIPDILKIQHGLTMLEDFKKLPKHPQAVCFQANIDAFLPHPSSNDKKIYGCIFSDQISMNAALLRAGLFVHTPIGMANDEQLFSSKLMTTVGGHDFNGTELRNYMQQAVIPAASTAEHQELKDIERQFAQQIITPIINQNQDNFIFFAIINTKKFKENLSHELLHAQYYNTPEIAPILLKVWQEQVSEQDKTTIKDALRAGGYDMEQQELLLREFYSYFLQYNAEAYLKTIKVLVPMAHLAPKYAPLIKKALNAEHIKILTVTGAPP